MMYDRLAQLQTVYLDNSWIRIIARIGLVLCCMLLLWWSGGFPPWAWRFLFHVLPQVPRLWTANGVLMVVPLATLTLLSTMLLVAWGVLILLTMRLIRSWRQERLELQRFNEEILDAHNLSEAIQETQQHTSAFPLRSAFPSNAAPAITHNHAILAESPAMFQQVTPESIGGLEDIAPAHTSITARDHVKTKDDVRAGSNLRVPVYPRNVRAAPRLQSNGRTDNKRGRYLDIGTGLDAGIERRGRPNEDNLFAIENITNRATAPQPMGLFIVADGMGGHGNGNEASQLAISAMRESVLLALDSEMKEVEAIKKILVEGVQHANRSVYKRNQKQSTDMGTTMTAALLWGANVFVVNVGDSRTYLYRTSEGLYQVTRDHSVVARLVECGAISPNDVYTHPKRNEILRALGNDPSVEVDCFTLPIRVGDVLLLCSDGLWEMVRDSEIQELVRTCIPHASQMCSMLIRAALNRGGKDNISVIAVCVRED
jgi:serine/threonine protein phosphatase PrpC